jgi:hypothetical protein
VHGAPAETWPAINTALEKGVRGLQGGSSLIRLLAAKRGVRNRMALPPLPIKQILKWCDEFHKKAGTWPKNSSMPGKHIPGSNGDTWLAVDSSLRAGRRGLPGGSSLAMLLAEERGVRNIHDLPRLTIDQILKWADAFKRSTGRWPKLDDWRDAIPSTGGETWGNVFQAVANGLRGLPGGFTFWELLTKRRGFRNINRLPPLTEVQILEWADAYFKRHGQWPACRSKPQLIPNTLGERWFNVHQALLKGLRGMRHGSSLARLLARHRGVPNTKAPMRTRAETTQ